jgi:hypothetical protein
MRKAFDANVPKLKPRLSRAVTGEDGPVNGAAQDSLELTLETGSAQEVAEPVAAATATAPSPQPAPPARAGGEGEPRGTMTLSAAASRPARAAHAGGEGEPRAAATRSAIPPSPPAPAGGEGRGEGGPSDVLARKERLDKIKRKVAEAARPQPRVQPVPADPARAAESVLGLVRDLEVELVRAREREDALRGDLDEARRELGRAVGEGRSAVERLQAAEKELDEKRGVLKELLGEMQALEEERDASVHRAQALATLDEERARLLEELGRRADEEARLRGEREAEVERLSEELRLAGAEGARLRGAVGDLARERDQLLAELDRTRGERDDLAEAKRALEAVHAALAQARARLG